MSCRLIPGNDRWGKDRRKRRLYDKVPDGDGNGRYRASRASRRESGLEQRSDRSLDQRSERYLWSGRGGRTLSGNAALPRESEVRSGAPPTCSRKPRAVSSQIAWPDCAGDQADERTMAAQGNVKVDGLESPVMVRQTDDRQVEVFLDYSLSITM